MTSISMSFYLLSPFSYEKAGKIPGTVTAVYPDDHRNNCNLELQSFKREEFDDSGRTSRSKSHLIGFAWPHISVEI
jgi:hypothetical protein